MRCDHVVLPLLHDAVVAPGWVGEQEFLAGYGLVQAMPGPLFTFSAYLGAVRDPEPSGIAGAAIALGAIFLPSFLLLGGVLPFWSSIRRHGIVQAALAGVGAAVVGVLAAALWNPVLTTSIGGIRDVLRRPPDDEARARALEKLADGTLSRATFLHELVNAPEAARVRELDDAVALGLAARARGERLS